MIHLEYTGLADGAMMSSLWLPVLARHAILGLILCHHGGDGSGTFQAPFHIAEEV